MGEIFTHIPKNTDNIERIETIIKDTVDGNGNYDLFIQYNGVNVDKLFNFFDLVDDCRNFTTKYFRGVNHPCCVFTDSHGNLSKSDNKDSIFMGMCDLSGIETSVMVKYLSKCCMDENTNCKMTVHLNKASYDIVGAVGPEFIGIGNSRCGISANNLKMVTDSLVKKTVNSNSRHY